MKTEDIIQKQDKAIRLLFAKVSKGEALDVTELLEFNKLTKEIDALRKEKEECIISDPEGLLQHKSMDIYAKEGYKVTVTERTLCFGSSTDSDRAHEYLKVGEIYTVQKTDVHNWQTDVYLKEFPEIFFNSVHFIPTEESSLKSIRDEKEEKPITRNEVKDLINNKDAVYGPGNKGYSNEPLPIDYAKIFRFLTEDEIKAMAPYSGKSCNEHWI